MPRSRRAASRASVGARVVVALAPWLACGCGAGAEEPGSQARIGVATAAVVGGEVDTTHPAVVYLGFRGDGAFAACSGTIIRTDPATHVGYVLTAAHCFGGPPPDFAAQGDDLTDSPVYYAALDGLAHPRFPEPGYDLGIVRIVGVDETTPTLPPLDPADPGPKLGDTVVAVGYGKTDPNDQFESNALRRRVELGVVREVPGQIDASGPGNVCSGDSGGPMLSGTGDAERVAAVNASADTSCLLFGAGTRVWPGLSGPLEAFMDEPVPQSCDRCVDELTYGHGACTGTGDACAADEECSAARACMNGCDGAAACEDGCLAGGDGVELLLDRYRCFCDPCAAACEGSPRVCGHLDRIVARRAAILSGGGAPASGRDGGCAVRRGSASGRSAAPSVAALLVAAAGALRLRRREGRTSAAAGTGSRRTR